MDLNRSERAERKRGVEMKPHRIVVNVATTEHYRRGQARLVKAVQELDPAATFGLWNGVPHGSPEHHETNYAFKAHALKAMAQTGATLLWCDSSIVPIASLETIWEKIEADGVWIPLNSSQPPVNYLWTADSAYADLFVRHAKASDEEFMRDMRELNKQIPHCATTAFGISLAHQNGGWFLDQFTRYAATRAFHGPWINALNVEQMARHPNAYHNLARCSACGPPEVKGHRHDQTAASVIAWSLGIVPTVQPDLFAYKGCEGPNTRLVADGDYL